MVHVDNQLLARLHLRYQIVLKPQLRLQLRLDSGALLQHAAGDKGVMTGLRGQHINDRANQVVPVLV
jgi:hypothetical protein